ncbi:MAG: ribonuclease III, partial [Lachnospiraceae bacterium]|nr:ribonuclease III [Lachnospiraceae bacterium]
EFLSRALVGELELGRGTGRTKKASEQAAAYQALLKLRTQKTEEV